MIARRESIESSSSEEIQIEKNQSANRPEQSQLLNFTDDDFLHRRGELDDPEQEFLLRLQERHGDSVDWHAILHCVVGDLKSHSDLKQFLEFERKQTTAPHKQLSPKVLALFEQMNALRHRQDSRNDTEGNQRR